jgi:3-hydroxyacyl-CoA dehydrogenase
MADQGDTEKYLNVVNNILMPLVEIDPSQLANADMTTATRDAMRSAGWKPTWFNGTEEVEKAREELMQKRQQQEMMQQMQLAGQAGQDAGKGMQEVKKAGEDQT